MAELTDPARIERRKDRQAGERSPLPHPSIVSELPVASVSDELSKTFLSLDTIMDCSLHRFLIFFAVF